MINLSDFISERANGYDVGDRFTFGKDPDIKGITWVKRHQYEVVHKDETQIGIALIGDETPMKYLTLKEMTALKAKRV